MTQATAYFDILTKARDDDGNLLVYGKATDSSLDIDAQICDPDWLRTAMPAWFKWGNIREQHSAVAAGVATGYEERSDGHFIEAKIVDPNSARKVEEGVLKGFSVGIRSPRVMKDKAAPGGRITGGDIVEVSLVDRPANENCRLILAKATATDSPLEFEQTEELVEKRDPTPAEREEHGLDLGQDDKSFPIANVGQLRDAIKAFGRAKPKDRAKVKAHIKRKAKQLGRTDLIPDDWKVAEVELGKMLEKVGQAELNAAVSAVAGLLVDEAMEVKATADLRECADLGALLASLEGLKTFAMNEAVEGESDGDSGTPGTDDTDGSVLDGSPNVHGSVDDQAGGMASAVMRQETAPGLQTNPLLTYGVVADLLKGASLDEIAPIRDIFVGDTTRELSGLREELVKVTGRLEERLAQVEQMATPGGPIRAKAPVTGFDAPDERAVRAAYFRSQAETHRGSETAAGYLKLAGALEAELAEGK